MRNRVLRFFLRHTAKTVPPAENMDRQLLYRLLVSVFWKLVLKKL